LRVCFRAAMNWSLRTSRVKELAPTQFGFTRNQSFG
jgi:hypothetical protein